MKGRTMTMEANGVVTPGGSSLFDGAHGARIM